MSLFILPWVFKHNVCVPSKQSNSLYKSSQLLDTIRSYPHFFFLFWVQKCCLLMALDFTFIMNSYTIFKSHLVILFIINCCHLEMSKYFKYLAMKLIRFQKRGEFNGLQGNFQINKFMLNNKYNSCFIIVNYEFFEKKIFIGFYFWNILILNFLQH